MLILHTDGFRHYSNFSPDRSVVLRPIAAPDSGSWVWISARRVVRHEVQNDGCMLVEFDEAVEEPTADPLLLFCRLLDVSVPTEHLIFWRERYWSSGDWALLNGGRMGYKGTSFIDSGYFYAPYAPVLTGSPTISPLPLPRSGILTRYGKKLLGRSSC